MLTEQPVDKILKNINELQNTVCDDYDYYCQNISPKLKELIEEFKQVTKNSFVYYTEINENTFGGNICIKFPTAHENVYLYGAGS